MGYSSYATTGFGVVSDESTGFFSGLIDQNIEGNEELETFLRGVAEETELDYPEPDDEEAELEDWICEVVQEAGVEELFGVLDILARQKGFTRELVIEEAGDRRYEDLTILVLLKETAHDYDNYGSGKPHPIPEWLNSEEAEAEVLAELTTFLGGLGVTVEEAGWISRVSTV